MTRELITTFSKRSGRFNPTLIIEKVLDKDGNLKKQFKYSKDPNFHFYVSKEPLETYQTSISLNDVNKVSCKYSELYKQIADLTKKTSFYNECIETGSFKRLQRLQNNKDIHRADIHIEDYLIFEYHQKYKNEIGVFPLHKIFFDIEVDTIGYEEGFPEAEEAPCPVNFISVFDNKHKKMMKFVLLNDENPSQVKFIEKYGKDCGRVWNSSNNKWCKHALENHYTKAKDVCVYWFKSELKLIRTFFDMVHSYQADYIGAYNAYFDFKTLETRIKILGEDPKDIMCPEEFPLKKVYIAEDTYNEQIEDKCDTIDIAGWGQAIDLQYAYLAKRKGQGKVDSAKLQDILLLELGEGKFELLTNVREEAYFDFENFLLYSGYDSYRLYELEELNMDVDLIHQMFNMLYTRQAKVFRKNVAIINLMSEFYLNRNRVISNNRNKFIEFEKEKFKGAFVALSTLVRHIGIELNGRKSNSVFNDTIDQDFTGLYPAIISAFQVGDEPLIGKIIIKDAFLDEFFGELLNEKNFVDIGHKVFNLPTFSDLLENIEDLLLEE